MPKNKTSILYLLAIALGVLTIWIPTHLPLVDFPQHVAQLAVLKDLLFGQTQWSEIVMINYFTPNLFGYFAALALTPFFTATTAFKILLSVAYIAFAYLCVKLRKHLKIDSRLDWLFLLPFFGYAYKWGFVTFLIAAPIGLFFILTADRYAKAPSQKYAILLSAIGLVLLESHGLMFLFSFGLGGLLLLVHTKSIKSALITVIPYVFIFTVFAIIYKLNSDFNTKSEMAQYTMDQGVAIEWGLNVKRIMHSALRNSLTTYTQDVSIRLYFIAASIIFAAPWLFGLRPDLKNKTALVFFGLICFMTLFVPTLIFGTFMIYQRFALFIILSYALLFSAGTPLPSSQSIIQRSTFTVIVSITFGLLFFNIYTNVNFGRETAEIDQMLSKLDENQRIYYGIIDNYSEADRHDAVYRHYPLWYQVEHKGFVEGSSATVFGNFASLAPFPVRYKPGLSPKEDKNILLGHAEAKLNMHDYRYLIVRNNVNEAPVGLFDDYPCQPELTDSKGKWTIYDTKHCQ